MELVTVLAMALVWLVAVTMVTLRLVPACVAAVVVVAPAIAATAATPAILAVERLAVRWPAVPVTVLATALPMARLAWLAAAPRL
jgi:hypothetical protein